jgi:hypothetical protein
MIHELHTLLPSQHVFVIGLGSTNFCLGGRLLNFGMTTRSEAISLVEPTICSLWLTELQMSTQSFYQS